MVRRDVTESPREPWVDADGMFHAGKTPGVYRVRATSDADPAVFSEAVAFVYPKEVDAMNGSETVGNRIYAYVEDGGRANFATMLNPDLSVVAGPVPVARRGNLAVATFAIPETYEGWPFAHFTEDEAGGVNVAFFAMRSAPVVPPLPIGGAFLVPTVVINNNSGGGGSSNGGN